MEYKRVLIITPFNPEGIGGAETFAKGLIKEAVKKVDIVYLTNAPLKETWDNTNIFIGAFIASGLLLRAIYERRHFKYETVHCIGVIATSVGVVLKKLFKIKLISTTLALYDFLSYPFIKLDIIWWIFRHIDKIFVEDQFGREEALKGLQIPDYKIQIFTHWVDMKKFYPANYPVEKKRFNVLFIGRPIYKKGKHIIQEIEKELKEQRLKMRFEYVENVPYEDLPNYYRDADVFVIPSLYDEGVARVVLEAAASGCAVIASNYGSLRELVKPFGIIISPTVEMYKKKILRLYMRRKILNDYKSKAYQYALQNFTKKNAEVIINEY